MNRRRPVAVASRPEGLSLSLWLRLIKAYNLILREVRGRVDPDLTLPQFDVLAQLARDEEPATPAALSRRLLVTAGNLTGIVDRLEERGLVRRETDRRDRRKIRIRLTDTGRARVRRMQPRHAREVAAILAGVPESEQRALRDLLGGLADSIEARTANRGAAARRAQSGGKA